MSSWLLGQTDYIFFVYGLAFIGLGAVSYLLSRDVKQRLAWIWLALFGCTHGLHEWLDLLARVWQEASWIRACRWGLLAASFLFLAEFGRLGLVRPRGRGPGRWLVGILALLGCLGAWSGWNGVGASTRYALGLVGGLSAGLALVREGRRNESPGRSWLTAAGAAFILYALAAGLVVPPAAFFPASALNFQTFLNLTGLPVALPRAFLAVVIIVLSLGYLRTTWPEESPESRRHRTNFLYGTGAALLVILTAGWILTQFLGKSAQEQTRKDTVSRGNLIIQRLTFELEAAEAAARAMSGSPWLGPALWSPPPQTLAQANSVLDRYQMRFNASPAYLMDRTGNTIAASNRNTPGSFVGHNFGIRPYFQEAMQGLPGRYFALGLLSKQPGFFAAFPVYDPAGKIAGVAVIKNTLTLFQQGLRESDPAFLIDPDGVIFLSSRSSHIDQSLWPMRPLNESEKSQFGADRLKPIFARAPTDGAKVQMEGKTYLFYRQYLLSLAAPGWSLVLLAPTSLMVFYRLLGIAATFILVVFTLLAAGSNQSIREGANRIVASEARFRAMFAAAPEAVFVFDTNTRKILDANPFMARWLGYSPAELLHLQVDQLLAAESLNEDGRWQCSVGLKPTSGHRYRRKDGSLVDVECVAADLLYGNQVRELVFVRDITERQRAEADLQTSLRFLEIVHRHTEIEPLLKAFVSEIKAYTGCEAVGIRMLDAAGGIPYLAYEGFSPRFYELESPLYIRSDRCMCINVIKGQVDPALPFYTPGGSFYLNGTSRFLATVSEADKGETRNVCNLEGYESVALIPFRRGEQILGLIHVADRQENLAPLHMVEMLEQAGMQLGSALMRIQAEAALRESESHYRSLFDNMLNGFAYCQMIVEPDRPKDFIYLKVNSAFENLTGLTEVTGKRISEVLPGIQKSDPELLEIYGRVALTGTPESFEIYVEALGMWFAIAVYSPRREYFVAIFDVITERKRAEEALRDSEEKYRLLMETANDAIFTADLRTGVIVDANLKAAELLGRSPENLLGLHYSQLFAAEDAERYQDLFRRRALKGGLIDADIHLVDAAGRRIPIEISSSRMKVGGKHLVTGIFRDVSERKRAEEEKARLEAQLVQAQKMEAIGTLAGGIAHDFNNILTAIMGNISLAMLDQREKSPSRERLTAAEKACLQAQNLARQLLTFAKGGAPIKELISFERLVTESASFAAIGSPVRCEFSFPDGLWAAEADPGQISQVFQNLVINAIQAMPAGGTIQVRGENLEVGRQSELPLRAGRYVKIAVQDQGIGIPADYLPKIFDPYFTTKQAGSGLGLATVYSIVKNHGGQVAVESSLGVGTTFQVYLPAVTRALKQPPEENRQVLSGQGKILVMDDEAIVRDLLDRMLDHLGYRATLAKDGAEALELFTAAREAGEHFAALILDLTVPGGMGGKAAIEHLLRLDPQVKAIVSSGYSDDPIMAEFAKNGFSGVITKPYRITELSRVLSQVLASQVASSS